MTKQLFSQKKAQEHIQLPMCDQEKNRFLSVWTDLAAMQTSLFKQTHTKAPASNEQKIKKQTARSGRSISKWTTRYKFLSVHATSTVYHRHLIYQSVKQNGKQDTCVMHKSTTSSCRAHRCLLQGKQWLISNYGAT